MFAFQAQKQNTTYIPYQSSYVLDGWGKFLSLAVVKIKEKRRDLWLLPFGDKSKKKEEFTDGTLNGGKDRPAGLQ